MHETGSADAAARLLNGERESLKEKIERQRHDACNRHWSRLAFQALLSGERKRKLRCRKTSR